MARAAREKARVRGGLPDPLKEAYFEARLRHRVTASAPQTVLPTTPFGPRYLHIWCYRAHLLRYYCIIRNSQVLSATSISIFAQACRAWCPLWGDSEKRERRSGHQETSYSYRT